MLGKWRAQSWAGAAQVKDGQTIPISHLDYTFGADGTLSEVLFDAANKGIHRASGKFYYGDNRLRIVYSNGIIEKGAIKWVDAERFIYEITEHPEKQQVGMKWHFYKYDQ